MYPILLLKSGKEANVGFRHPWIFSGALEEVPAGLAHGSLVRVSDKNGRILGTGTYSAFSSIAVRVLDFKETTIDEAWFVKRFEAARNRRQLLGYGPGTDTTAFRVVFGESDGIPGLVVDRYVDVFVMQIATAGLEALRETVVKALKTVFEPRILIERSDLTVRKEEKLEDVTAVRIGDEPGMVEFLEHGERFIADVRHGQKTGFFLDQKDLRQTVRQLAKGRSVLNLFSYSGATGIMAMKGGAASVHNVDGSDVALDLCKKQAEMHAISADQFTTEKADIFPWFGDKERAGMYGLVIVDPPALIKSHKDIEEGKKAYHFLNRSAMRLVKDGGIFVTSSCSHFLSEEDFAFLLRRASVQAGLSLSVLSVIRQSPDHPMSVYFPEAAYLKTFVCEVARS